MLKSQYSLTELLDIDELGTMLAQLYEITKVPSAILDLNGNFLTAAGLQNVCKKFHRKNREAAKLCLQSDTHLLTDLSADSTHKIYTCPHGLVDSVCPIVVDGRHVANAFIGQILHEPVSDELRMQFKQQAKKYEFDEVAYIEALEKVPIFSVDEHARLLDFLSDLTKNFASMGLARLLEREQAEASRINEERLRLTQEEINDGLWEWNEDKKAFTWSLRTFSMLGIEPDELSFSYDAFNKHVHPEDRLAVKKAFQHSITDNKPFKKEFRFLDADGDAIFVLARGKMLASGKMGSVGYVLGSYTDITKLKVAEEKFAKAFDHSPLLMSISKVDTGKIITVNKRFTEVLGYSLGEVVGKTSASLNILSKENREYARSAMVANGEVLNGLQVPVTTKAGKELQFVFFGGVINLQSCDALLLIAQDVTEQLKIEKQNRVLEQQLQQSAKLEALGTLAGGIAHDFNNILSAVLGHGQLALEQVSPSADVYDDIEQVLIAGNRAADLVKRILLFSRQEVEEFNQVRVQDVIGDMVGLFQPSIPSSIEFTKIIDENCGTVFGSSIQIHQVLMNLCTNARQAIASEYGEISISLSEERPPALFFSTHDFERLANSYACLKVHDSGSGIPPGIRDKIFDPFFTTKGEENGTGLGLSVVDGIVRKHSGLMLLESSSEKGTTFQIYFPIMGAENRVEDSAVNQITEGKERILFVDDEVAITDLNKRYLEKFGYSVTSFTSSNEAYSHFQEHSDSFDLVVTDMSMPDMTGMDLILKILKINPDTKSILSTGYSNSVNEQYAKELGVDAYLPKPYLPRVLAELINEVCKNG